MKRRVAGGVGVGAVAVAVGVAAWIQLRSNSATADGTPGASPLVYSGVLEDNGTLVSGMHTVEIILWNHATNAGDANRVCTTTANDTPVLDGRFRVTLVDDCADGVAEHPDIWVQVLVDAVSLGRTKLGAVPYALEAGRASAAAGQLAEQVVPSGMIAMFAGSCPNGWTEQTAMRGRFPRGEPGGDPGSLGNGGSDDAVVVSHSHSVSGSTNTTGNHTHTQSVTANPGSCPGSGIARADWNNDTSDLCTYPQAETWSANGNHSHTVTATAATAGESGAGKNRPAYQEVIFCRKQ
ncbi:MAG TPA: hypothetical protein VMZ28_29210 [Kofleriaceae bacterium]|nr:hypothetical protein [Kofleriaceae bacterium]